MHSHNAGITRVTKLYSMQVGGVLQWHNAHYPTYCLCHTYISLMVS